MATSSTDTVIAQPPQQAPQPPSQAQPPPQQGQNAWLTNASALLASALGVYVTQLAAGSITSAQFKALMEAALLAAYMAAFARGSGTVLDAADQVIVDRYLSGERKYLQQFAEDLKANNYSPAYLRNRVSLYADAIRALFWAGYLKAAKLMDQVAGTDRGIYWHSQDDGGTCAPCMAAQEGSPYTAKSLPGLPGADVCEGLDRCRCWLTTGPFPKSMELPALLPFPRGGIWKAAALPQLFTYRQERRFLMPDVQAVRDLLTQRGDLNDYGVVTKYVDTPEGTWSKDPQQPRFRLRIYDDGSAFLEQKVGGRAATVKDRQKRQSAKLPDGWVSLGQTAYSRTEWPPGDSAGNVRVTIDRYVRTPGRKLPGFVVEVKLPVGDPLPKWLLMLKPYETQNFSKWKWISG